jgi:acetyl-CoA carboxylase carboxyl transferase subunit beta
MSLFKRRKKDVPDRPFIPDGMWHKCASCNQTIYRNDFEESLQVCPRCGFHYRLSAAKRIEITVDPGSFRESHASVESRDPLGFVAGGESYEDRLERAREESGLREALLTGSAAIEKTPVMIGVMDSRFIGASMGSAAGEKFLRLVRDAIETEAPLVIFTASGGARMQEGILALMQMARTADAVRQLNESAIPFITVLTDPTTGGVFASFASLGDVILAEPGAYIGFAGSRLIEGALKVKLPEGFQTAEYHFENGFIDAIVKRNAMRDYLARLCRYLDPQQKEAAPAPVDFFPK